jgi:hypothetical protein
MKNIILAVLAATLLALVSAGKKFNIDDYKDQPPCTTDADCKPIEGVQVKCFKSRCFLYSGEGEFNGEVLKNKNKKAKKPKKKSRMNDEL